MARTDNPGMFPVLLVSLLFLSQAPAKDTLPGATNVTRVDATIACGGATTAEAYPELKKRGFVSVVSLRRESETGRRHSRREDGGGRRGAEVHPHPDRSGGDHRTRMSTLSSRP